MAAEYSANALQTVPANGPVIFSESPVPCNRGIIFHRDESGLFRLASPRVMGVPCRPCCCCVGNYPEAVYDVAFHANISVPGTHKTVSVRTEPLSEETAAVLRLPPGRWLRISE